jgi:alanine-glyoxylate transaminase/serine-glyoxylate transaminase/serine-pyruvate transaminase
MIPGPIEFDPNVLQAMSTPTTSHVAPQFVELFGRSLENMRKVWLAEKGQPFVIAGSGTFAMDMAVANTVEPGDKILVYNTGYFSDRMHAMMERYGAEVKVVSSELGEVPALERVEEELKTGEYCAVTITHVDTSTGIVADVKSIAALANKYDTLSIVDGVCATAGVELRQDEWGVDVYLTASQKAVGVPPGLALLVFSQKFLEKYEEREAPVQNFYADIDNWLPIMEAYEARDTAYFGTPAVNLMYALDVSLTNILEEGMEARFARHKRLGKAFKAGIKALGLREIPNSPEISAPTLSAVYFPEGVDASLVGKIKEAGVIVAGGLHPEAKDKYFRVGHMGSVNENDILATLGAIEQGLAECDYSFEPGAGLSAARSVLQEE